MFGNVPRFNFFSFFHFNCAPRFVSQFLALFFTIRGWFFVFCSCHLFAERGSSDVVWILWNWTHLTQELSFDWFYCIWFLFSEGFQEWTLALCSVIGRPRCCFSMLNLSSRCRPLDTHLFFASSKLHAFIILDRQRQTILEFPPANPKHMYFWTCPIFNCDSEPAKHLTEFSIPSGFLQPYPPYFILYILFLFWWKFCSLILFGKSRVRVGGQRVTDADDMAPSTRYGLQRQHFSEPSNMQRIKQ